MTVLSSRSAKSLRAAISSLERLMDKMTAPGRLPITRSVTSSPRTNSRSKSSAMVSLPPIAFPVMGIPLECGNRLPDAFWSPRHDGNNDDPASSCLTHHEDWRSAVFPTVEVKPGQAVEDLFNLGNGDHMLVITSSAQGHMLCEPNVDDHCVYSTKSINYCLQVVLTALLSHAAPL